MPRSVVTSADDVSCARHRDGRTSLCCEHVMVYARTIARERVPAHAPCMLKDLLGRNERESHNASRRNIAAWRAKSAGQKGGYVMIRLLLRATAVIALGSASLVGLGASTSSASTPTGEVTIGHASYTATTMEFTGGGATVEPAYDYATGGTVYILTPTKAKVRVHGTPPPNVAPLYLVAYPVGSGIDPMSLDCAHMTATLTTIADNCPDHGFLVAGGAMALAPTVYGTGVVGHDHLVGLSSTGGDFNVVWEPVLVLFTSMTAAMQHITTLTELEAATAATQIIEIPLPTLDFNCPVVSAAVYAQGTPAPVVGTTT